MEQVLDLGDRKVISVEFCETKEIEVGRIVSFKSIDNRDIIVTELCDENYSWNLSKEEFCTFIKLLVSHLELPLEFK